jgi:hypothetical protein
LVGVATSNSKRSDPHLCVLIPFGRGWESSVVIENSHTQAEVEVMIDYDNLLIRCKLCFEVSHCFKDCPNISNYRRPSSSGPRVEVKNKNEVQRTSGEEGVKVQINNSGQPLISQSQIT